MTPPKVVHLTSVHDPDDNRIFKQARSLAAAGFSVTLIAPGDRRYLADQVQIKPVPKLTRRSSRLTRTVWAVYREAVREDGDIYHFHDPELLPIALLLRARRKKVLFDVHENVPEQMAHKEWIPENVRTLAIRAYDWIERHAANRLSAVVTANEDISRRFDRVRKPVVPIHNYPDLREFDPAPADCTSRLEWRLAIHTGGIDSRTSVLPLIEAMGILPEQLNVRLVITGPVEPKRTAEAGGKLDRDLFQHLTRLPGWQRVDYRGKVSRSEMIELMASACVAIVLYDDELNHAAIRSNRFFEALACGLPVIAPDFPEWRRRINDLRCGLTVDPRDPNAIATTIEYLFTHPSEAAEMGRHARFASVQSFEWAKEAKNLCSLYLSLLNRAKIDCHHEFAPANVDKANLCQLDHFASRGNPRNDNTA